MEFYDIIDRSIRARKAAHSTLSQHERSKSRIILLEDLAKRLSGAPIDVQDYFQEAISCLENNSFRSGVVLSWCGQFHVFSEKLYLEHEQEIRNKRQKWQFTDLQNLKEQHAESQILDVAKDVGFIKKSDLRVLQGYLSQRNQCAHPTLYRPSMNFAIGYVDEMIQKTLLYL